MTQRRYVFTLNNYTDEDEASIKLFFESDDVSYGVYGRETGANGTPHLQGFVILKSVQRISFLRRRLSDRAHYEPARGTSQQAADYCKKDGSFFEHGTVPFAGRRTDLAQFVEWGDSFTVEHGRPPSTPDIARECPINYLRQPRASALFRDRAPAPVLQEGEPRAWQLDLDQALHADPDDRTVRFYVDTEGGTGKTWFQKWFFTQNPALTQLLSVGKRDDLAHSVDTRKRIFFFNVPRGGMEHFQYTILEQLKDGIVFSPKYNSRTKILGNKVHVVVFCNEYPDMTKMSADRYQIIDNFN